MEKSNLNSPSVVSLVGAGSMAQMSALEGWDSESYCLALADSIRHSSVSLDCQRERLVCLAAMGETADSAAGAALAQHFQIAEALYLRFAAETVAALNRGGPNASVIAERYNNAAVRAQKAALGCLSALKAIRDTPTRSAPVGGHEGPGNGNVLDALPGKAN